METNYLDETTIEESGYYRPDQPALKKMMYTLIAIYSLQNILSAEMHFNNMVHKDRSESFGQKYLVVERWFFWIAYAVLPALAIVISFVAIGVSETTEMKAFFWSIILITLLTSVFIFLFISASFFQMLEQSS